jgi:hypothetical protein
MRNVVRILGYASRLFWFLELLVDPTAASEALLNQAQVKAWLAKQPAGDQKKIRDAAPLVIGAIVAAMD